MKKIFWFVAALTFAAFTVSCDDEDEYKGNDDSQNEQNDNNDPNKGDDNQEPGGEDKPGGDEPGGEVEMLDVTFQLAYSELTATSVNLSVVPSSDTVGYYYDLCTDEVFQKNGGDINAIVELYLNHIRMHNQDKPLEEVLKQELSWGPDKDVITGMPMDTEFHFYALAVNNQGQICSEPSHITFRTLPKGNPEQCTFDFEFASLTATSVNVTVKPSDLTIPYFTFYVPKDEFPGDYGLIASVEQSFVEFAQMQQMPIEQVVSQVTVIGEHNETFQDLEPNTAYYVYAFPINNKGQCEGGVSKKLFTTVEKGASDANITLDYKYFDGNELYESDPQLYARMKDKVLVQGTVTPNKSAEHWFLALAKGDLSDEKAYPDEANKDALAHGGKKDILTMQFVVNGWETCTFLYFAIDEMGIDGVMNRDVVTFTKENASPISEVSKAAARRAPLLEVKAQCNENRLGKRLAGAVRPASGHSNGYRK